MKFIIVWFDFYTSALTTMARPCERVNIDFQQGLGDQYWFYLVWHLETLFGPLPYIVTKSIIAPFLKLRMITALNDNSKHNFYDHQKDSNRIPSLLMVLMHLI